MAGESVGGPVERACCLGKVRWNGLWGGEVLWAGSLEAAEQICLLIHQHLEENR